MEGILTAVRPHCFEAFSKTRQQAQNYDGEIALHSKYNCRQKWANTFWPVFGFPRLQLCKNFGVLGVSQREIGVLILLIKFFCAQVPKTAKLGPKLAFLARDTHFTFVSLSCNVFQSIMASCANCKIYEWNKRSENPGPGRSSRWSFATTKMARKMHFWDPSQWYKMYFGYQRIKFQWKKWVKIFTFA